jgi:TM2 domain-containing membrane protein YozV
MNDFFQNVSRYASYFVTVILGIFFFTFGWLKPLLQKPATAIALFGFLIAGIFFISFTLRAMLGLNPV